MSMYMIANIRYKTVIQMPTWTSPLCSHRGISSFPTVSLVPAGIQGQSEQKSIEYSKLTSLLSPQMSVKVEELVNVDDLCGG